MIADIEEMALNCLNQLPPAVVHRLATEENEWYKFSDQFKLSRIIEGEYGLWEINPITDHWRDHPEERNIVNGLDRSEDYPHNIAMKVVKTVVRLCKDIVATNALETDTGGLNE